ncbi:MAG: PIG-L family deacetylase [Planctomycetota bacterium]|jgi:LmbE family N-acetylglucosaminyl deacetylase|nr:MAG: PIG-L family deacetylase [Planctomycetota bacterium]
MRSYFLLLLTFFFLSSSVSIAGDAVPKAENKLRIIVFGAHPDDAEYKAGGTAAKWAKLGHHVKLVSVTNGDIGHWKMAGGPLALRRKAEVKAAAKILGVTSEVLDIHDGELLPTLENRKTITRLIREWNADIVIAHRPWDYHPDHRYVGVLVQDAAFMVTVPFFCPDVAPLKKNPVFLYSSDGFQKPYPFVPDVAVSVDDVFDIKLAAIHELPSQAYEGGANGSEEQVRALPPESNPVARKAWLKENWSRRQSAEASRHRELLVRLYGEEAGRAVKYAETFELCEYGSRPNRDELKRLFPFFDK